MLQESGRRIGFLDVWRTIAVVVVVASHYVGHQLAEPLQGRHVLEAVSRMGRFGVLLFFCISGFVICRGLRDEHDERGAVSLAAFYLRRIVRIVPPLLMYLAGLVLFAQVGVLRLNENDALHVLAFACNLPLVEECSWWTAHTWSLAYEEQFYLAFPLALVVGHLVRRPLRIVATCGVVMAAAVVLGMLPLHHFYADYAMNVAYLLVGCAAAFYLDRPQGRWLRDRTSPQFWMLATTLALLATVAPWTGMSRLVWSAVIGPLAVCVMIFCVPLQGPMEAVFGNAPLRYIGRASYSIYLWQQLATRVAGDGTPMTSLLIVLATVVCCLVTYQYIERPLIRIGARWSERVKSGGFDRLAGVASRGDFMEGR